MSTLWLCLKEEETMPLCQPIYGRNRSVKQFAQFKSNMGMLEMHDGGDVGGLKCSLHKLLFSNQTDASLRFRFLSLCTL